MYSLQGMEGNRTAVMVFFQCPGVQSRIPCRACSMGVSCTYNCTYPKGSGYCDNVVVNTISLNDETFVPWTFKCPRFDLHDSFRISDAIETSHTFVDVIASIYSIDNGSILNRFLVMILTVIWYS